MKKNITALFLCSIGLLLGICLSACRGNKIQVSWEKTSQPTLPSGPITLQVYVENSGSMDAYMCPGSTLKDAVFDYVSDLKKYTDTCRLYYLNSQPIPYKGRLDAFIKDLTPASFSAAGGNRSNTDLRAMFGYLLSRQKPNTVTVFVSDCILDIPEGSTSFLGNCQVTMKSLFNDALAQQPQLGVQILQLESTYDGYWYCGANKALLSKVKRPYYIWVIGDHRILARLNQQVPLSDIMGGVKASCAYAPAQPLSFNMDKTRYVVNHSRKIQLDILADLRPSLQTPQVMEQRAQYRIEPAAQSQIVAVRPITVSGSPYSHVITVEVTDPATVRSLSLTYSYPFLPAWVEEANDDTGKNVEQHLHQTTGILSLIKGVAEAYKSSTNFGTINLQFSNH